MSRIEDADLAALPLIGAVDQYVDSTPVLSQPRLARALMSAAWSQRGDR